MWVSTGEEEVVMCCYGYVLLFVAMVMGYYGYGLLWLCYYGYHLKFLKCVI